MNTVGRARNARINQAIKHANELLNQLNVLKGHEMSDHVDEPGAWQDGRNALEQLTQCFHEANAYNNAMKPD